MKQSLIRVALLVACVAFPASAMAKRPGGGGKDRAERREDRAERREDRRDDRRQDRRDDRRADRATYDRTPRQAPPARRAERAQQRAGHVWVSGQWDWQNGNWSWAPGKLVRSQRGRTWREPTWQQQGDIYVRVGGTWDAAPAYPTYAPPAPRYEAQSRRARRGYVFVAGSWNWVNYSWQWTPGRWERQQAGRRYRAAQWQQRGDRWDRIEGSWEIEVR